MDASKILVRAVGICAAMLAATGSAADHDWPMWRYDAGRTGCSPSALPADLELQWRRDLPPVAPAWGFEVRMQFDTCYEPIAAWKSLFVGSPIDGSVTAYRTADGTEKWRFHTNGPVRFAPVAWQGRIYVASDDGRVYCLDAEAGTLRWSVRVAPGERPDLFHLGNNRLISFWPVRGGPLIVDGTLYVGAGLWPVLGTFVSALDAETGKVRWRNDRLHYMADIRIDHNRIADASLAPQGYIVLEDGKLLVANGRSMPVGLAPDTGTLLYYVQGYRNGHCRVTARGKNIFVGRQAVLDLDTGREMGSRWREGDKETPKEYSPRYDLFETPFVPYKFIKGCDAWSVLAPGVAHGVQEGVFYAYDLAKAGKSTYKRKISGHDRNPGKWEAPLLWQLRTESTGAPPGGRALIVAGNRLYGHVGSDLMGISLPDKGEEPAVLWKKRIPGVPATMLAADGKLFVVTQEGQILCFGPGAGEPTIHARVDRKLPDADDAWCRQAAAILGACPEPVEGYCLVLGLESGRLAEELLRQSAVRIVAVDPDRQKVDRLRRRLAAAGLYGTRAECLLGDPFTFRFPPYFANLVVSEIYTAGQVSQKMGAAEFFSVLRPYGGAACLTASAAEFAPFASWVAAGGLDEAKLTRSGDLALLRRIGALTGSSDWTHESCSPARTYFSKDKRVKLPLAPLWYGDGPGHGFRKHKDYHIGVKPEVVDGRLFAFNDRSHRLRAYDVYTGRVLWEREVAAFTRFASMSDGIYVAGGNACVVYDPATGAVLRKFDYGVAGADRLFVADLRVGEDVVVVAVAFSKVRSIPQGLYDSDVLIGLNRQTGKQLWQRRAEDRFNHHGLALGNGTVFCTDSPSMGTTAELKRRGDEPETLESTVLALAADTGAVKWEKVFANPFISYEHTSYALGSVQSGDDALFYSAECDVLIVYKDRRYRGVKAGTGEQIWEQERGAGQPIMVQGEVFFNQGGGAFDVRTGGHVPAKGKGGVRGGNGCNHAVACENLFLRRTFTAAAFDRETGRAVYMRNVRSGCTNSLIPACGVLSSPCFSVGCVCNHPLETSFCLVNMPVIAGWGGTDPIREPMPLGERDPAKLQLAAATPVVPEERRLVLIPSGSPWRYLDDGSDQGGGWTDTDFDDSGWRSGPAELGYGDHNEKTVLSFGPNPQKKFITTYFRCSFPVPNAGEVEKLSMRILHDDGVVVYLNGREIHRGNMPDGPVGFATGANHAVFGAEEGVTNEVFVPAAGLVAGRNVLAVEIHQAHPKSSDISFDMELAAVSKK